MLDPGERGDMSGSREKTDEVQKGPVDGGSYGGHGRNLDVVCAVCRVFWTWLEHWICGLNYVCQFGENHK